MRLAFIKKSFSIHGGAERYLQALVTNLKSAGHEIHIFANQWSGENGIFFHKVDTLSLSSFLSVITFNKNVKRAIKKDSRPDCLISFERTTCQDIYRAGEGCHSEWLEIRSKFEPLYKRLSFKINPLHTSLINLEKRLFSNTRLILANSKMVKEQIIKHYAVPEERITVIYNGVDLMRFSPENKDKWHRDVRRSLNISNDPKVLLFVGSGFKRKGLKTLINAIPIIKREDIKALIIGKGDVNEYKTLAEKYGISDKIIFLGAQKEIEKFYAAADLFILPTLYDPFSNATLEAMASGLPVITTRNNGMAELIENGHEGFVLDNLFDAQELADKISLSLGNIAHVGEKARKKAEKFPIEKAACEFMEIIKQAVK
ncbi:MAG: glycosyltransferase family 4 protein [Nitrospirota bacterium]